MVARALFDVIRSEEDGNISGSYTAVGSALTKPVRSIAFNNTTENNLFLTDDTNEDKIFVAAGGFKLWDAQSNMNAQKDDSYQFAAGTQFYVKTVTDPAGGAIYIEGLI